MNEHERNAWLSRGRALNWNDWDWAGAVARREIAIRELEAALADCRRNKNKLLDRVKRTDPADAPTGQVPTRGDRTG